MMQDKIEKTVEINAPIEKVWRSLTDYREFGNWFRVALEGPFEVGKITVGVLHFPGWEGTPFWVEVIKKEPMNLFSFRWPYDESTDPELGLEGKTTLVEFRLEEIGIATRLTVTESGFAAIPAERRPSVIRDNTSGWNVQTENLKKHAEH